MEPKDGNIPVSAGDKNLGQIDDADGEPGIVDGLDRTRNLDDERPDCAFGKPATLRLETAVLEMGRFRLDICFK